MVSSVVADRMASGSSPVGLSAGRFSDFPATKPQTITRASGTSFSTVSRSCTKPASLTPRTSSSVTVQITATATAA